MPKKKAIEFYYDEVRDLYRKRIKDPATGKWVDVYGHTKDELRQKVKGRQHVLERAAAAETCPYVYEYAAKWYSLNTADLKPNTKASMSNAINNHICPVMGNMLMADVTLDDGKKVLTSAAGSSKALQKKIVSVLKRMFADAAENRIIDRTPFGKLKAGGTKAQEKTPLTAIQQRTLIDALDGTKAQLFVRLGLFTGMRREEILALQWDCVHLDADPPYISVRRALTWVKSQPEVSEDLKSDAASRDIPLPDELTVALKAELKKSKSEYVIPNDAGKPMSQQSFRNLWHSVEARSIHDTKVKGKDGKLKTVTLQVGDKVPKHDIMISIDFDVTPHLLRHTYITELILGGANLKTVQYLAGHATAAMTLNIYSHIIDKQPKDTVGAVHKVFPSIAFGANQGAIS